MYRIIKSNPAFTSEVNKMKLYIYIYVSVYVYMYYMYFNGLRPS